MSRDDAYLIDILTAARKACSFVEGVTREDFAQDALRQHAIARLLTIIGEAASKVSGPLKAAQPAVPWPEMIGMRNRIVHDYLRVNWAIVWDTVRNDLPALITALEPLVPPEQTP